MAEDRKKNKRRAYLNDFRRDESGKYAYEGAYIKWYDEKRDNSKTLAILWLCAGLSAAASIAAGCLPNPWTNIAYALLPYIAALILNVALIWLMFRFSMAGDTLRAYFYEKNVSRLPIVAGASAVFTIAAVAGDIAAVFVSGIDAEKWHCIFFIIPEIIVFVSDIIFIKIFKGITFNKN